jgi:hypothetical protein
MDSCLLDLILLPAVLRRIVEDLRLFLLVV